MPIRLLSFVDPEHWPFGNPDRDADGYNTVNQAIKCNGFVIKVTKNLHDFLQAIRGRADCNKSNFWIDALCINQSPTDSTGEKPEQVKIMAKVYKEAKNVIVWLGKEDDDSRSATRLMNELCMMAPEERAEVTPMTLKTNVESTAESKDFPTIDDWRSLARFFYRRYFKRAWVVQEIICAKRTGLYALCGSQKIHWSRIQTTSNFITDSSWGRLFHSPGFTGIEGGLQPHHGGPATLAETISAKMEKSEEVFMYSLIRSREYDCSCPKDKIYSLIGLRHLQDSAVGFTIEVDYDQEDHDIYTQTAMHILDSTEDLLLLYYAEEAVVGLGIVGYRRYWADNKEPRHIIINGRGGRPHLATLELRAWPLDTISKAGESKQDVYHGKPCAAWLKIVESLGPEYDHYGHHEQTKDVFWRTLVTNTARGQLGTPEPPDQDLERAFAHWISRTCRGSPHHESEAIQRGLNLLEEWGTPLPHGKINTNESNRFASIFRHTNCLRLFRTTSGLLGLGTTSLHEGDQVCIVPGSRVPLIFRPAHISAKANESGSISHTCDTLHDKPSHVAEHYNHAWHLVGACYLHGVMHGEAARRFKADGKQLDTVLVI
ncbi:hypothetical protein CERZMDRAFT_96261 [Cercospora zeae-maydis SCOH1-5]|uniref:Heterokaryon incompatibility domain-containing protein n=1 Tax=Cercospora zeae-maydis SCOH1-5 TaxID=717836 RepID=A0A6A6FJK5_9PEZI|nr:hypothetical protein CERZMDRAFT_96261 [Cercospora zeae-maydis SCOH1-5]